MKKLIAFALIVLLVLSLSIVAMADEEPAPGEEPEVGESSSAGDGSADDGATSGSLVSSDNIEALALTFVSSMSEALATIPTYYNTYVGSFLADNLLALPLLVLFALIGLFGYKCYGAVRVVVGGLFGFALSSAALTFLTAWTERPAALDSVIGNKIVTWVAIGIITLIFMGIGSALRRVGLSLAIALYMGVFMTRYTSHLYVLLGVMGFVFLVGLFSIKTLVISTTAISGGMGIVKWSIGTTGFYPVDIEGMFGIHDIDPMLLAGVLVAILCILFQIATTKSRKSFK